MSERGGYSVLILLNMHFGFFFFFLGDKLLNMH